MSVFSKSFTVEALLHYADDPDAHDVNYIISQYHRGGDDDSFAMAVARGWGGMDTHELYYQARSTTGSNINAGSGILLTPGHDYYIAFSYDGDMTGTDDVGAWFRVKDLTTGDWMESAAPAPFSELNTPERRFYIGHRGTGTDIRHFSGYIDEVRISAGVLPFAALLVPEPGSAGLLLFGAIGALLWRRRR